MQLLHVEKNGNKYEGEEEEEEGTEDGDDIMARVKQQQTHLADAVSSLSLSSVRCRKQQALHTAQCLASDPLVAVCRAVDLNNSQRKALAEMSELLEEAAAVLLKHSKDPQDQDQMLQQQEQ